MEEKQKQAEEKQKKIYKFLKRYIKPSLLNVKWENEGMIILKDRDKLTLSLEEKEILKFLIAFGTPPEYRPNLWKTCSGAKREIEENSEYYYNLKKLSKEVPSLYEKQIRSDIKRTNPKKNADPDFLDKLYNILVCYSIRNSSIGYCQGFNFIVSRLLEIMLDEEDSFWAFCELIEEILPINYYSELCGVMVDTSIVTIFLKKYFPELKGILCDEILEPLINNYIQQSILGLFTSSLSEETSLFVWDFLFLEGNIILVKTFLALFGCLKKNFLQSKGDIEIVKNIIDKDTLKLEPSNDVLLHSFLIKKFEFNEEYLEQTRFKFSDIIAENLEDKNLENVQCKVKPNEEKINNQLNKNCCKRWPYCLYDGYFENVKTVIPYLIISHQEQMNLHSNYFFDEYTATKERKSSFHEDAYNIMLERRQHYCTEVFEELKKERETTTTESSEVSNADLLKSSNMQMREMFTNIQNIPGYQKAANQIMKEFKPEPFRDINQGNNGNIKEANNN